jgi:hypothetical protein
MAAALPITPILAVFSRRCGVSNTVEAGIATVIWAFLRGVDNLNFNFHSYSADKFLIFFKLDFYGKLLLFYVVAYRMA